MVTDTLINGQSIGSSLRDRLLSAAVGTGAAVTANEIGIAYAEGNLDPVSHKIAHALLGCAVGAANGGGCGAGAVGAALGETVAGIIGQTLSGDGVLSAADRNNVLAASQIAGILGAAAFGGDAEAASAAASNAVLNNYLTAQQIADFKHEMEGCGAKGGPQCQDVIDKYDELFAMQARTLWFAGGPSDDSRSFQALLNANDFSHAINYLREAYPGQTEAWYQAQAQDNVTAFFESIDVGQKGVAQDAKQDLKALAYGLLTAVAAYPAIANTVASVTTSTAVKEISGAVEAGASAEVTTGTTASSAEAQGLPNMTEVPRETLSDLGKNYTVIAPRGSGAANGPLPSGYATVSRWVSPEEATLWIENQGTVIPNGVGAGGRVYVTDLGAAKPGGTGPIRIDFAIPKDAVSAAGKAEWGQIFQPSQSTPIYNVKIYIPEGVHLP